MIDGSGKTDFRKWKKTTMHPTHVHKKMTAGELLVCVCVRACDGVCECVCDDVCVLL